MTYPIGLDLSGKRVVVVGAGTVTARRLPALLDAGADVVVVAPHARPEVSDLAAAGTITWRQRAVDYSDVCGAWLIHIATDDPAINRSIADEARRRGIWAVRADDARASDAHTPASGDVDGVEVSVISGDPARSRQVRDRIVAALSDGSLNARPRRNPGSGRVVLIGGGPGDGDLITIRGRRELLTADVVVHDRLGPNDLLRLVDPDVEVIDAGKAPDRHTLTQEEINHVIVDRARAGLRVARLKGGDPFVLGRGSEEVLACLDAGIPVEVVPGISSAISAPAAAGIPVTHRGTSTGFVVISGHVIHDLSAVAATGLTTVILMGVATLPRAVEEFLKAGRPGSTPAAVIHRAHQPGQRVVTGTLADIVELTSSSALENPSVVVIGDVVDVVPRVASHGAAGLAS